MTANVATGQARVDWVDYAKGFCIVMVVLMHSTLGVEAAAGETGWAHAIVAFAKPFRMPDFFLISGLFLARVIDRDWTTYLDRKVVHFAYFYALWVTIQFAFKAPVFGQEYGWANVPAMYLLAFVQPFGTLWFIYLLPIFFVVTKLARRVPPAALWLFAAALEIAPIDTGSVIIDEFASRFVYFYTGYVLATPIFRLAGAAQRRPAVALSGLALWAVGNFGAVAWGVSERPFLSLGLGLAGASAVVTASALMARRDLFTPLRYCGRNSIVIYLAFFLPMAASRTALLKFVPAADLGTVCLLVTAAGVLGALAWFWAVRGTPLRLLFERPARLHLAPPRTLRLEPAE
ncbi:MAG TPA: acyltransferase family protein [Xanthobacteraceae bacterium]|nr:acyltransferase family protein [Xanthobacteraceae bacterium]